MKQRTAATGSERQARYRRSKKLGGVFLTEATRMVISSLQVRTGLKKEAVVALAVRKLTADLDRKERARIGPPSADSASTNTADSEAAGGAAPPADVVQGEAAPAPAPSLSDGEALRSKDHSKSDTGQAPRSSADAATKRHSRVRASGGARKAKPQLDDIPDLFGDLLPRR